MSVERRATRRSITTENVTSQPSNAVQQQEQVMASLNPTQEIKTLSEVNANLSLNLKDTAAILLDSHVVVETNGAVGGVGANKELLDVKNKGTATPGGKDENGIEGDEESNSIPDRDDEEEEDDGAPDAKIAKLSDDTDEQSSNMSGDQLVAKSKAPFVRKEKIRHQCTECDKSFQKKGFLTKHMKSHSQPRPFVCDYEDCDKAFATSRGLEKHVKVVHQGEEYCLHSCAFCKKGFITRSEMECHAETHLAEYKMYACRFCGKTFGKKYSMKIAVQACVDGVVDPCPYCNKAINPNAYKDN